MFFALSPIGRADRAATVAEPVGVSGLRWPCPFRIGSDLAPGRQKAWLTVPTAMRYEGCIRRRKTILKSAGEAVKGS